MDVIIILWKTIESKKVADFPLFKVFEDTVQLPNGLKLDYYMIEKIPVVVVLPISSGKIVMVKQYRYPIKTVSLELPASHVWLDETPIKCAKRELKEETGFTAGKIEKVLSYHPSTEYSDQVYHIFIAEELKNGKTNRKKYEIIKCMEDTFGWDCDYSNFFVYVDGNGVVIKEDFRCPKV